MRQFKKILWNTVGKTMFRLTPHNAYRYRTRLLKLFGMKCGKRVRFRRNVSIDKPWNITSGDLAIFGDCAIVNASAPIRVGKRCVVSQYAMLMTKQGDCQLKGNTNIVRSIHIEDDSWVAADTLVLPGSHLEQGVVVGARSLVDGRLPSWSICTGEPATKRTDRVLYGTS